MMPIHGRSHKPSTGGTHLDLANTLRPLPRPPLQFTDDGPGHLSVLGPRHDNDHADYRDIQILPTADEILAVKRSIYMPKKNLENDNFLGIGVNRHLDLLFRQLRCDSIESIRDMCYSAAQVAFLGIGVDGEHLDPDKIRHETVSGSRYFLYRNVRVEELLAHEAKAMLVRLSYHCPTFMRGRKMIDSGRFQQGMLVALLELDRSTNIFSVYFLEVRLAQSTMSMDSLNGAGLRAAVQLSFVPDCTRNEILQVCRHALGLCPERELALVEFPTVLYAGFQNCLHRLQQMHESDISFAKYVAPQSSLDALVYGARAGISTTTVPPPAYATAPGFTYNLRTTVTGEGSPDFITLQELSNPATLKVLQEHTTLDYGQAIVFRDSLMREFAFTQGPPGCGKTFLGVQLVKTLLQSRARSLPILVVCLTNHGLDNLLADLRDAKVGNLLRIGSASKEEWTSDINLHNRRRKFRTNRDELFTLNNYGSRKKEALAEIDILCKALSTQNRTGTVSWQYIQDNLERNYPGMYTQLSANIESPIGKAFAFEYWSKGGDLDNLRSLHVELASRLAQMSLSHSKDANSDVDSILLDVSDKANAQSAQAGRKSVWNLSLSERRKLLQEWESEVDAENIAHKITTLYLDHQDSASQIRTIINAKDAKIMAAHDIIGMTTTACASRWEVLRSLQIEILICEEAGELMEAQTLCSLLPTLQHAIFIGDPMQLRPKVTEQALTLETAIGAQYRLDESLLERLMYPRDPALFAIPTSKLDIQRRMHPEIANIARIIYPYLKDHECTYGRPLVHGLQKRMYWWDHRVAELDVSNNIKSHINLHEVEMVSALVEYLLKGGAYTQGEIAVLTPYSGQLAKLNDRLSTTCDIWLSDKDREVLLGDELLALGQEGRITKDEVPISDMLRLTSVDNFQGEEAKVIILSTVRSGGRAGFLKTTNRINVACSRARDGFYIIGNSETLRHVSMWRRVVDIFGNNIGETITTYCHTHPAHRKDVRQPGDFASVEDCPSVCGRTLDCGHGCREKCHPPELHERLVCQEQCSKTHGCGHQCPKLCYQACGKCELSVNDVTLSCGHSGKILCSGTESECVVVTNTKKLPCGHDIVILCCENEESQNSCSEPCCVTLPCGHPCLGNCQSCTSANGHLPCSKICGWEKTCGHTCKSACHPDKPCSRSCLEPCSDRCEHGPCKNRCSDACDPCVKHSSPRCTHYTASNVLCCLPDISLPCCTPCDQPLECGHACPSFHGEVCPPKKLCPQCLTGAQVATRMLYMPECNHLVEIQKLDDLNGREIYNIDARGLILAQKSKICAQYLHEAECICGILCPSVHRYSSIAKLIQFPRTLDLLIAKMGRKMYGFARSLEFSQQSLTKSLHSFVASIRPNPMAAASNMRLLLGRDKDIFNLYKLIAHFRRLVVTPFEQNLDGLHSTFPSIIPAYLTLFPTRFSLLEYRAMNIRITDNLNIACHLVRLGDPSYGVQRQGIKMMQFVLKESLAFVEYCQHALDNHSILTAPPIEAELRLQQAQFLLLAKDAFCQLSQLGVHNTKLIERANERNVSVGLRNIVDAAQTVYSGHREFKESAQQFLDILLASGRDHCNSNPTLIKNDAARDIERAWGQHELGGLRTCRRLHVFSNKSFPEGCPSCGVLANSAKSSDAAINLREADFLKVLHGLSRKYDGSAANDTVEIVEPTDMISNTGQEGTRLTRGAPVEVIGQSTQAREDAIESKDEVVEVKKKRFEEEQSGLRSEVKREVAAREKFLAAMRNM